MKKVNILNPDVVINDSKSTISETATIYSYENSTAQTYAEEYERKFIIFGQEPVLSLGDIDGNNVVDAIDASLVLSEYASLSTGQELTFTDEQRAAADVDGNTAIDAIDASYILSYYAYISTGGKESINDFIN